MLTLQQENIKMYTEQAKNGSGDAAFELALIYRSFMAPNARGGVTIGQDWKTAADWFLYAALHNNPEGAYELGANIYYPGRPGVPKDHPEAYSMIRWAADHGSGKAVYFLTRDRDGQNLLAEVGKTYVPPTSQGEAAAKAMLLTILGAALFTVVAGAAGGGSSSSSPYQGRQYSPTGMNSAQCHDDQLRALFGSDGVSRTAGGTPRSCLN